MPKWKELGYVPDSDEEDELRSSQPHRSTTFPHASLRDGKLDTAGEHGDRHLGLPRISEEGTEGGSCNVQTALVHHPLAVLAHITETGSRLTSLIGDKPTS
jgi:hypothetical protein